jgi:hypothetical protein
VDVFIVARSNNVPPWAPGSPTDLPDLPRNASPFLISLSPYLLLANFYVTYHYVWTCPCGGVIYSMLVEQDKKVAIPCAEQKDLQVLEAMMRRKQ